LLLDKQFPAAAWFAIITIKQIKTNCLAISQQANYTERLLLVDEI
jgi:hypothetical protein